MHGSVLDRRRFEADPDPTFHFYDDKDLDPDPTPYFIYMLENLNLYQFTAVPVYVVLSFLVSVMGVIIFDILDSIAKSSGGKYSFSVLMDQDPDSDPDPDLKH